MENYVYKVTPKYSKIQEDGTRKLSNFFDTYEGEDTSIYATGSIMKSDSPIVRMFIDSFNNEKFQKNAGILDDVSKLRKFEEENGITYNFNVEKQRYEVEETPELIKDLSSCQVCVDFDDPETTGYLFINCGDGVRTFYNSRILDKSIPTLIKILKSNKVIYKKRIIKKTKENVGKA